MKIKVTSEKDFYDALEIIKRAGLKMIEKADEVSLEVTKFVETRSVAQNNYYFKLNSWIRDTLKKGGCTYGEFELPYTTNIVHDINKQIFGYETTKNMTVQEFYDYITEVTVFWTERTEGALEIPETPREYLIKHGFGEYL